MCHRGETLVTINNARKDLLSSALCVKTVYKVILSHNKAVTILRHQIK